MPGRHGELALQKDEEAPRVWRGVLFFVAGCQLSLFRGGRRITLVKAAAPEGEPSNTPSAGEARRSKCEAMGLWRLCGRLLPLSPLIVESKQRKRPADDELWSRWVIVLVCHE